MVSTAAERRADTIVQWRVALAFAKMSRRIHAYRSKGTEMKRIVAASIVSAIAFAAVAQTAPPKPTAQERQRAVTTTTQQGSGSSASTQKTAEQQAANVKASRQTAKLSTQEKTQLAKDATRLNVNPENSSGQAATARMQTQTVARSKGAEKQSAQFRTKEGKAYLARDLQQKSSP
jgi:hypothetical protein